MMEAGTQASALNSGSGAFPRTRWTLVIQAASPDETSAQQALEEICGIYWQPIYAYLRRSGHKPEDAEDLTQGFFAELLSAETFNAASRDRGRLRSFLLGSLKRFLSREHRYAEALKRGGNSITLSLDHDQAELRYASELVEGDSPDLLYERAWANEIVRRAQDALGEHFARERKTEFYHHVAGFLSWDKGNSAYRETAVRLGISETSLRTSVYRMRKRYRQLLEAEITETVETPAQAQEELRHLLDVLGAR